MEWELEIDFDILSTPYRNICQRAHTMCNECFWIIVGLLESCMQNTTITIVVDVEEAKHIEVKSSEIYITLEKGRETDCGDNTTNHHQQCTTLGDS